MPPISREEVRDDGLLLLLFSSKSLPCVPSIRRVIKEQSISELQSFYLVDSYVGSHLVSSKKSYTLRFVLQDAKRTLKDQYANKVIDRIMQALHTGLGAIMRK